VLSPDWAAGAEEAGLSSAWAAGTKSMAANMLKKRDFNDMFILLLKLFWS
jgi:hypothetical protein